MHFRSPILIGYDLRRFEPQAQHCGTTGKRKSVVTMTGLFRRYPWPKLLSAIQLALRLQKS